MKKYTPVMIAVSVFAVLLVCCAAGYAVWQFMMRPVSLSREETVSVRVEVPSGRSIRSVARELQHAGVIRSELFFYAAARAADVKLKSGVYTVSSGMSVADIFELIQSGRQDYIAVSIPEGLTVSKIAGLLEDAGVTGRSDFIAASRDAALLADYAIPAESFEGYLFPDTYYFNPAMDAEQVVRMMADTFFARVATVAGAERLSAADLFYVVRLASIVEREYRLADEAPLIASVFANRLRRGIGLYSCATVEYVITEIEGRPHPDIITNKDLKLESPYNTYLWAGLPPGPISNPGLVALNAAANPPVTPYYYFRLVDPASGAHHFSADFDEHVDAGNLYTKKAAGR